MSHVCVIRTHHITCIIHTHLAHVTRICISITLTYMYTHIYKNTDICLMYE